MDDATIICDECDKTQREIERVRGERDANSRTLESMAHEMAKLCIIGALPSGHQILVDAGTTTEAVRDRVAEDAAKYLHDVRQDVMILRIVKKEVDCAIKLLEDHSCQFQDSQVEQAITLLKGVLD